MIYNSVDTAEPIKQGDIFRGIPRVDFSFSTIAVIDEDEGQRQVTWRDVIEEASGPAAVAAVLPVRSVDAIVITQNCDAVRGEYLCLCQIDEFLIATGKAEPPKTPRKWTSLITRHSRENLRWFYLPPAPSLEFEHAMAVDFRVIIRVQRMDLEMMRDLRIGCLSQIGAEHFRESLAHFFRRYPYNEWYPLTKDQFQAYAADSPEPVKPYPWQE